MRRLSADELTGWIEVRYDTARGPGGQHVNKTATRATVLFDFVACDWLSDAQRGRIVSRLASRLSADGRLQVTSQAGRSQAGNREAALARLVELLAEAFHEPRPRRPTRPSAGSRRRRLEAKRRRGELKQGRQRRAREES